MASEGSENSNGLGAVQGADIFTYCSELLGGAGRGPLWAEAGQLLGDGPGYSKERSGHVGERLEFLFSLLNLPFSIHLFIFFRENIPSYGQSPRLRLKKQNRRKSPRPFAFREMDPSMRVEAQFLALGTSPS